MEFKVFLSLGDAGKEVRRFRVDEKVVRLEDLQARLGVDDVILRWEDEEGDLVDIVNEDEWELALTHMRDKAVYRLFGQIRGHQETNTTNGQSSWPGVGPGKNSVGEEHPGILCCCCHQQVRGFRYKCVVCPNYDMCGNCEGRAIHPAHDMVRIPNPKSYPPHFFMRLHRLYERCNHSSPTLAKTGCSSISPSCENMTRDLLADDDHSDASDLELEVSHLPGEGTNLVMTMQNLVGGEQDEDDIMENKVVLEKEKQLINSKENLPSFEELTRSMQDLAEKDIEEYSESSTVINKSSMQSELKVEELGVRKIPDEITDPSNPSRNGAKGGSLSITGAKSALIQAIQNEHEDILESQSSSEGGIDFLRKKCLTKEKNINQDRKGAFNEVRTMDYNSQDDMISNRDEIDTSDCIRSIQQEIESLLAPLTPLPDLESVPKVVKTNGEKEMFVLRSNINEVNKDKGDNDNYKQYEKNKHNSFEFVDNRESETGSSEEWSWLGDSKININNTDEKENEISDKEESCEESSETENEDIVNNSSGDDDADNDTDCDEMKQSLEVKQTKSESNKLKNISGSTAKLNKEKKDLENSAIASSKYLSQNVGNMDLNGKLEDSLKNIENSLKNTSNDISSFSSTSNTKQNIANPSLEDPTSSSVEKDAAQPFVEDRETSDVTVASCSEVTKYPDMATKGRTKTAIEPKVGMTDSTSNWKFGHSNQRRERHYNTRVADALDKMEGMGYTDNDGWLTQLLVMKHGDISQVLEILTPVQK